MTLPNSIKALADALAELPSIGPRQALRLALYLVDTGPQAIRSLAGQIDALSAIKHCERCFFVHDEAGTLCPICADAARDHAIIMIVEKETDFLSIENTKKYRGRYVVLGPVGKIGLLEEWQKLRLQVLKNFIQKNLPGGKAKEIVLGFNPTSSGDFNASSLAKELSPLTGRITRLGRGLPTGGEIEFADDETLGSAVDRRS
jgi:recombination protein RecR